MSMDIFRKVEKRMYEIYNIYSSDTASKITTLMFFSHMCGMYDMTRHMLTDIELKALQILEHELMKRLNEKKSVNHL